MAENIKIEESYITLGQFLKHANIISSGGMAKPFLMDVPVWINGERDNRRGKKLRHGDIIEVEDAGSFVIESSHAGDQ
ncbi:S4 domain-containing protein YaaA [Alkalibacterium sp. MB6]|uniref:S4 domain-containing protein YaaA n=1 Tax=Alkalibacterium sp. MB6 TaxID=2081965 RepID=UPI00137A0C63|nr:S4 domain-containing protein YaaA [Alkalibacterium sp. MB6]